MLGARTVALFTTSVATGTVLLSQLPGCEPASVTERQPRGLIVERVNVERPLDGRTPYADLRVNPNDETLPQYHAQVTLGTNCTVGDYFPGCED